MCVTSLSSGMSINFLSTAIAIPCLQQKLSLGGPKEHARGTYVVHDVALGNARKFCNAYGPSQQSDALSSDEFAPQSIYVRFLGIAGKLVKF